MGRFYDEYLRDMSYKNASKKVERRYSMGGDWTGGREDITGMGMTHLTKGTIISPHNPQYVPGVQMGGSEAPAPGGDYVYRMPGETEIKFYEFGGDIDPLDEDGNERQMPTPIIETYQLNLKGTKGKSSTSKDYQPEGTKKNGKYLHYTEAGPKWLDDPVGFTFEQAASEGAIKTDGYEYVRGQGWTYKEGVPTAPTVKKEKKRKKEKIIKLADRSIEQIPNSDLKEELKKLPPFELTKNNTEYFTIEKQGTGTHTYPTGEDGKVLIRLKDKPGRTVWSGSQTEFQQKYGEFLEQRKGRLYLKEYGGGTDELDSLKMNTPEINMMPTDSPTWTPIDPDSGTVTVQTPEKIKFLLNKSGWADIKQYREKSEDSEFIKGTQDLVITDGFDIANDGIWGNKTYNAINQDLVNKQLNSYTNPYFTDAEFTAQIYKESTGDNSKVSPKGAMGIAQFLPSTFKWAKEKGWIPETAKITDVAAQSLAQRRYMDYIYEDRENVKSATTKEERKARTFAAYNMGPGNFDKFWKKLSAKDKKAGWETWYKKMNKETKMYVLWNMDRVTYKKDYSTSYKNKRGQVTSKWHNVNYGFDRYKNKNLEYRY